MGFGEVALFSFRLPKLTSVARFTDSAPVMIVSANHNRAEGRSIDFRGQPLLCDHGLYLVVIRDDRSQFTALALVADKAQERVENVFQPIV